MTIPIEHQTCVHPDGRFIVGTHRPVYTVANLRASDHRFELGRDDTQQTVDNDDNFPHKNIQIPDGEPVFEIRNPFPFKGTTYILSSWADRRARQAETIGIPAPPEASFSRTMEKWMPAGKMTAPKMTGLILLLPDPLKLALASTGTDPADLEILAALSCDFINDKVTGRPIGLVYERDRDGRRRPAWKNRELFETLANNPHLPDDYKLTMVLKPGVQGNSEIVGEYLSAGEPHTHVFEYLRRNSYVPWGHYAANMAHDAIRYRLADLMLADTIGMRHLYYQRVYVQVSRELGMELPVSPRTLSTAAIEDLRLKIMGRVRGRKPGMLRFNGTLWGWNYGFDRSPSSYRLHASHQQIHQQYALLAEKTTARKPPDLPHANNGCFSYACGDLVTGFIAEYRRATGKNFFDCYFKAIYANQRTDGRTGGPTSLVVFEDEHIMLFVPKAQTSQWELQVITKSPVGNILESDTQARQSLDRAIWMGMRVLEALGAKMITAIEYSKRFDSGDGDQRLLYALLPRLPESPGAFSEAQLRWINGHYPEDFAWACREKMAEHSLNSEEVPEMS
ncbi:MAG: hypothetical protein HKM93_03480 [Desulfobacteraceae bacterium]|nr:hypothetical protein [Desulfobacteraceae bacterium]